MNENKIKLVQVIDQVWNNAPEHVEHIFLTEEESLSDKWLSYRQHEDFWQLSAIFERPEPDVF